ncbi:hypothetical protein [Streptomyces sp. NPDC005407]|uniref:hypothetical protein n=1 Tax=Streptomyces sp. NPDC005407 TaxID=3155340 RepID=UPI0033B0D6B3
MPVKNPCTPSPGEEKQDRGGPTGPSAAQVAGAVSFPALGSVLAMAGMPMTDVFTLLGGCGTIGFTLFGGCGIIGAATAAAAAGRRRLVGALAGAAVRAAAQEPRP